MLWKALLLLTQSSLSVQVDADIRRPNRSLILRTSVSIRVIVPRTWIARWNLVHELTLARERERVLIGNFDRLKQDYNDLRLRVEGEVHNLSTANRALNQDRFKAVGMAYDSLTTFLNQSFNSSRAVTGFVNKQDAIMLQILRYASEEVPGLETFLKSTPAPIPIAAHPPATVIANSAVLAGARTGSFVQQLSMPVASTSTRPMHPLPARPRSPTGNVGNRYRHNRRKAKKFINSLSKENGPQ
ncbi:hypothetical protein K435DRAFT_804087 [Dendrothele bispora CBS 962.96]|uniref:Uncharacterized protein n=1 Tax=Dendrothele bispora (strain CBS 962.96) TaxID=1314807 RepID=A0A4S8LFF3_DENBC|nr:hypothetical protein K435DRAFT_804087 [Dendrothele bispora CBS 962.96]